ncbi:KaiC domain-containing protein [Halorubrum sp. SD626R]|uniref:KaiC domain-containing protein n=1 Tax=Halorubrum TaxID=56688 RepID=UPI0010F63F46|nr:MULTISPECIES: KaiC domain-containing protein [Halorubrum]TKX78118.1 KaiC domain-containing protein [Halorubrum sp. SD626R]
MSEEDDWFERALGEIDEASDGDDRDADSDDAGERSDSGDDGEPNAVAGSDPDGAGAGDGPAEDDPFGGFRETSGDDEGDADSDEGDADSDGTAGGDSGAAPDHGTNFDDGPPADADPFGGYRGTAPSPDDEFGFASFGGGAGETDAPGGADAPSPAEFDVDPEEFESAIPRIDVGIEGLDEMILGGIPARSLISVIGGAGTGKTTFALQFLNAALESGGKGVYITLEQTRESILSTAAEKGWSFEEHAAEDRLAVVAIDPIEMANSLASIRNDLTRLIAEFDADRLVLDSVSLLEMMYDHPAKRRSEVFGFTRSLKDAGVTTLLTSEASDESAYASRHGIVEYLTDAVFVLQYVRGSDFRETRLAVEIQKIRDANHSRETKPYDITDTGISVYDQANIF